MTFTGENAHPFVSYSFVLTEHISHFSCARADVACGNVAVGADVFAELGHKTLAETHYFAVGFAFGIKVRTALGAAHGQSCQAVFEHLFESQKFDYSEIYGRMQPYAAFIGSDGGVELNSETAVDVHFAVVILPGHSEHNLSFGFDYSFENARIDEILSFFDYGFKGSKNFGDRLDEFGFAGVSFFSSFQ